jgi:DNA primase
MTRSAGAAVPEERSNGRSPTSPARYLRQWLGYNLTGDMGEQIFQIWYGPLAANGKSTFGNQCREAIGDYGDTINVETFLDEGQKKRGDQATPDLVRLPGVRLLTAGEPPKGAKINEALINSVTGGDPMNVRDNFRSVLPLLADLQVHALVQRPADDSARHGGHLATGQGHPLGTASDRSMSATRPAEEAARRICGHARLDGARAARLARQRLRRAGKRAAGVADYKHDSDPLSNFLRLCTVPDPQGRVQSSVMHETYLRLGQGRRRI